MPHFYCCCQHLNIDAKMIPWMIHYLNELVLRLRSMSYHFSGPNSCQVTEEVCDLEKWWMAKDFFLLWIMCFHHNLHPHPSIRQVRFPVISSQRKMLCEGANSNMFRASHAKPSLFNANCTFLYPPPYSWSLLPGFAVNIQTSTG